MALQLMGFVLSQSEGLRGSRYFPSHPTSLRIATMCEQISVFWELVERYFLRKPSLYTAVSRHDFLISISKH